MAGVLPDMLQPGLRVVFCGTAAGTASARAGAYYAGPGNAFWATLHSTGLTPVQLSPAEFERLFGRAAFGFGTIGRALGALGPREQALLLLGWLVLREDPVIQEGMHALLGLLPGTSASLELAGLLVCVSATVPTSTPSSQSTPRLSACLRRRVRGEQRPGDREPSKWPAQWQEDGLVASQQSARHPVVEATCLRAWP